MNDRLTSLELISTLLAGTKVLVTVQVNCREFDWFGESLLSLNVILSDEENSELTLLMEFFDFIYCWTKYSESLVNVVLILDLVNFVLILD